MTNATQARVPKIGDHVTDSQHQGAFEVVFVNALMQTANIRLIDGTAHVMTVRSCNRRTACGDLEPRLGMKEGKA